MENIETIVLVVNICILFGCKTKVNSVETRLKQRGISAIPKSVEGFRVSLIDHS